MSEHVLLATDLSYLVVFARQLKRGVVHTPKQLEELTAKIETSLGKKMVNDLLLEHWDDRESIFIWKLV